MRRRRGPARARPGVAALAAIAGALALVLAASASAAPLGAASAPPSAFDLASSSPLAVLATVGRREPVAGRLDAYRVQVAETFTGDAPEGLLVVAERAFASDPAALAEGKTYLLFLGEVPTQSLWRPFHGDAHARHLARASDARPIEPASAAAVSTALRDFLRSVKDDPAGSRRLDFLLAQLVSGPPALRGDAAAGLAARPASLRSWVDDAKLAPLGKWLGDASGDPSAQAAFVQALEDARVSRAAATLLEAGRSHPPLRPAVLRFLARLAGDDEPTRSVALDALAEWRSSDDAETRVATMTLAAQLGGAESVGFLAEAAIGDVDDDAAVAAVTALAGLGRDEARAEPVYAALGRVAREGRDRPASRAIEALALTGTARGVAEITSVFGHRRPGLEIVAVMALLNANHPDAFAAIRRLREAPDTDPRVRQAIDKITGSRG